MIFLIAYLEMAWMIKNCEVGIFLMLLVFLKTIRCCLLCIFIWIFARFCLWLLNFLGALNWLIWLVLL